jgi:hypothetical protein
VVHRANIDRIGDMVDLALALGASRIENDASYTIRGNRCLIAPKVFESLGANSV